MNKNAFAQLLKEKRQELNYSQGKVARLCFISRSTYNHYERGLRVPTLEVALRISNTLKLEPIAVLSTLISNNPQSKPIALGLGIVQEDSSQSSEYQSTYSKNFIQLDEEKQKAILDIMEIMLASDETKL